MKTITLVTKKKNQGKKKRSQHVSNKGRKNERKKIKSQHIGDLKVNFKGIFGSSFHEFLPLSFLSILERKLFGRPGEKTPKPHHLFSFLPTQPNTLKKIILFLFSLQSFPSSLFHLQTNTP